MAEANSADMSEEVKLGAPISTSQANAQGLLAESVLSGDSSNQDLKSKHQITETPTLSEVPSNLGTPAPSVSNIPPTEDSIPPETDPSVSGSTVPPVPLASLIPPSQSDSSIATDSTPLLNSTSTPGGSAPGVVSTPSPPASPPPEYLFDSDQVKQLNELKKELQKIRLTNDAFSIVAKELISLNVEKLPPFDLASTIIVRNFLIAWQVQVGDQDAPFNVECSDITASVHPIAAFIQLVEARSSLNAQKHLDDSSSTQSIIAAFSSRFPLLGNDFIVKLGGFKSLLELTGT